MTPKRTAALAIFAAETYEAKHKCLLAHWGIFVPYLLPAPADHENDLVEWAEDRFEVLSKRATEWLILDLMTRVEALESPNGEYADSQ